MFRVYLFSKQHINSTSLTKKLLYCIYRKYIVIFNSSRHSVLGVKGGRGTQYKFIQSINIQIYTVNISNDFTEQSVKIQ